jgi:peptidoglycan-associated lipoprotein
MQRKHSSWPVVMLAAVLGVVALTGCAKKATVKPPAPAEAPPQTQTTPPKPSTETPPTPAPVETSHKLSASDLQPVFFDFDASTLRDDARSALDADAHLLRDNPDVKVVVEGHCDERGTPEYNQALGERRAKAAKDYLVQAGIAASRLETISYGKERPFDPGHDEAAWAKNRRAHFSLP